MAEIQKRVSSFKGPLFVVGMPRSGTKLLRDLLNNHPLISIPDRETSFFPHWVRNWNKFGDLSTLQNFTSFYKNSMKSPYFYFSSKSDKIIDLEIWFKKCRDFTPAGVFEALLRHDAKVSETSEIIWGDKSPDYLHHIILLKKHFPEAKFIHIIRDVRDHCLSMNKAWGKNMSRSAQRWVNEVTQARGDIRGFEGDNLEILYEHLIGDPQSQIERICSYLNLEYLPEMTTLKKPAESIGDAKGAYHIVSENKNKYLLEIDSKTLNKIEAIASSTLKALGYDSGYKGPTKEVPLILLRTYQLFDFFNLTYYTIRRRGLITTLKLQYGFLLERR